MTRAPGPERATDAAPSSAGRSASTTVLRSVAARRSRGGFFLLPFIVEKAASPPATNATWAWTLRRLARYAVWLLPGYAIWHGVLSLVAGDGANPAGYLATDRPLYVVGWVIGAWFSLLALLALTGQLIATRSRGFALAGFLAILGGVLLMLPFAGLSAQSPAYGPDVRAFAVTGAVVCSVGWTLTGWAIIRSGVFSYGDGGLLILAGPLLGIGAMFSDPLQILGAIFVFAAGIGIAWRTGRLIPVVRPAAVTQPPDDTRASTAPPAVPEIGAGGPMPAANPAAP